MTNLSRWEKYYEEQAEYFVAATEDIKKLPISARQAEHRANRLALLTSTLARMHAALLFICELREDEEKDACVEANRVTNL